MSREQCHFAYPVILFVLTAACFVLGCQKKASVVSPKTLSPPPAAPAAAPTANGPIKDTLLLMAVSISF